MTLEENKSGFKTFLVIWSGQLVSLLGSGVTGFALGIWVLQRTGSVTDFALISLFTVLPRILLSPIAGALVDRWDRRRTMMMSEAGAAIVTFAFAALVAGGRLETWHIYAGVSFISACSGFQWPAYVAATSMLVSKRQLGRASGLVQVAHGIAQTVAPIVAGTLLGLAGMKIEAILLINTSTYVFALATLLLVQVPAVRRTAQTGGQASLLNDIAQGLYYLRSRPALLALLAFIAATNFLLGLITVLVSPLVLSFASPAVLGTVMTAAGMGMFAGSVLMGVWGGPQRKIQGVFGFMLLSGSALLPAGLAQSASLIAAGAFVFLLGVPVISGCCQAILQGKVAHEVQGRVFAVSGMIASSAMPLAYLSAGPLADRLFEPLLAPAGPLAGSVGLLIGVGPGRGIAFAFMVLGFLFILLTTAGYLYPPCRHVEDELPDASESRHSVVRIETDAGAGMPEVERV